MRSGCIFELLPVDHGNSEFAQGKTHINGIESFWAFVKKRFSKYKGMSHRTFSLYLKECEPRFNNRD
jgi:transposase-like protein